MIFERILLVSSAISTALILNWILHYSNYGIDFTDESFYLVWMSNPFLYDWSVTQFGFIYHPLYLLLDGDIARIRQANIIITFVLSWILLSLLLKALTPPEKPSQNITRIIVAAGFAVASLIAFDYWLPTPSYNSLTFQALLISSIGLLLATKAPTRMSISGWFLIGAGGWLTFMAKPSTALALTVAVALYLILARKLSIRMILTAMVSTLVLLLISALMMDGSVFKFIDRLRTGIQFAGYLDGGHTLEKIMRVDDFLLSEKEKITMLVVAVLTFVAILCTFSKKIFLTAIAFIVSILFLAVIVSLTLGFVQKTAGFGKFQGLMIWAIVFPAIALGLVYARQNIFSSIKLQHWVIALLFLVMPHIYTFGTNSNYWQAGAYAAIFWLLTGVIFLGPLAKSRSGWGFALPLVLASQAISASLLQTGLENPYRQPQPLRLNDRTVKTGASGSNLILSEGYANYLDAATTAAQLAGFKAGNPIIDLSGQSPGILYALRAENIGQAWTIGGYPGSLKRANEALSLAPCERIASAWLLMEPDGPRSISEELLASFGGNLIRNYLKVASWSTASGAGGFAASREQVLYKPLLQSNMLETCRALKLSKSSEEDLK